MDTFLDWSKRYMDIKMGYRFLSPTCGFVHLNSVLMSKNFWCIVRESWTCSVQTKAGTKFWAGKTDTHAGSQRSTAAVVQWLCCTKQCGCSSFPLGFRVSWKSVIYIMKAYWLTDCINLCSYRAGPGFCL